MIVSLISKLSSRHTKPLVFLQGCELKDNASRTFSLRINSVLVCSNPVSNHELPQRCGIGQTTAMYTKIYERLHLCTTAHLHPPPFPPRTPHTIFGNHYLYLCLDLQILLMCLPFHISSSSETITPPLSLPPKNPPPP